MSMPDPIALQTRAGDGDLDSAMQLKIDAAAAEHYGEAWHATPNRATRKYLEGVVKHRESRREAHERGRLPASETIPSQRAAIDAGADPGVVQAVGLYPPKVATDAALERSLLAKLLGLDPRTLKLSGESLLPITPVESAMNERAAEAAY